MSSLQMFLQMLQTSHLKKVSYHDLENAVRNYSVDLTPVDAF